MLVDHHHVATNLKYLIWNEANLHRDAANTKFNRLQWIETIISLSPGGMDLFLRCNS